MSGYCTIKKRALAVTIIVAVVGYAVSVWGAAWAGGAWTAGMSGDVAANAAAVVDHESRIRTLESTVTAMATDVRWIRARMEGGRHGPPE